MHLGGHLAYYETEKQSWTDVQAGESVLLIDLARRLGIPEAEVALWVVNGEAVDPHLTAVSENDEVRLYPPMDGG